MENTNEYLECWGLPNTAIYLEVFRRRNSLLLLCACGGLLVPTETFKNKAARRSRTKNTSRIEALELLCDVLAVVVSMIICEPGSERHDYSGVLLSPSRSLRFVYAP